MTTKDEVREKILEAVEYFESQNTNNLYDLYYLADMVQDIAEAMADYYQETEPYAAGTIAALREGGKTVSQHIRYMGDDD